MNEMDKKLDLNNLDKANWLRLSFDNIAKKISKTVQPHDANVDIYVGLEHIDPNEIHIRRKGVPSDVKGAKLQCALGDVIFGKRRAYQRKAAIVDFYGICSAHSFVFRAIPEVIDPKLFPFFLHSDQFMHRMVDISVGGLSPTINWSDLKDQEFLIPPKPEQAKLAELLWALDNQIEKDRKTIQCLVTLKETLNKEIFALHKTINLGNNAYFEILSSGIDKFKNTKDYISTKCVEKYSIMQIEETITFDKRPSRANMQPITNSIWFARMKDTFKVIKPSEREIKNCIFSTGFCGIKPNEKLVYLEYLFHFFLSNQFNQQKDILAKGTTQKAINNHSVKRIKISIPDIETQRNVSEKLNTIIQNIELAEQKIKSSKNLNKTIINEIF